MANYTDFYEIPDLSLHLKSQASSLVTEVQIHSLHRFQAGTSNTETPKAHFSVLLT